MRGKDKEEILSMLLSGKVAKKYRGKQVVIFDRQVFILPENDEKAAKFVNSLIAKKPGITPTITFVPKQGTYILVILTK
jgi:hypothetical protein